MYHISWYISLVLSVKTITSRIPPLRIIDGKDGEEDSYPYIVRLALKIVYTKEVPVRIIIEPYCTGSLLSPSWTLTAAHCTEELPPAFRNNTNYTIIHNIVKHGPLNNSDNIFKVLSIHKHPAYKMINIQPLLILQVHNDIALLKSEEVKLNKYGYLSVIDYTTIFGQEATVFGYGLAMSFTPERKLRSEDGSIFENMQMLEVMAIRCAKDFQFNLKPGVCLSNKCKTLGHLCQGDSGGPMIHPSGIVGVNSMGSPLLCFLYPMLKILKTTYSLGGAVTPTSPFTDWISSTIQKHL